MAWMSVTAPKSVFIYCYDGRQLQPLGGSKKKEEIDGANLCDDVDNSNGSDINKVNCHRMSSVSPSLLP